MPSIEELRPLVTSNLISVQIQREREDFEDALIRASKQDIRAAKAGKKTRLERLSLPCLSGIIEASSQVLDRTNARGRKPEWYANAEKVGPDVLASLSVRAFTLLACQRAGGLSLKLFLKEAGFIIMRGVWTVQDMTEEAEKGRKKGVVSAARARSVSKRVSAKVRTAETGHDPDMDEAALIKQGVVLWNILHKAGLVAVEKSAGRGKKAKTVERHVTAILTDTGVEAQQVLLTDPQALSLVAPIYRPMLCPPKPWTSFYGGGYLTRACHTRLIRKTQKEIRDVVQATIRSGQMNERLRAVNALQSVPLRINEDALWLREHVWENKIFLPDVTPNRVKRTVEEVPDMADWEQKDRVRFLMKRSASIKANRAIPSLCAEWERDSREAEDLYRKRDLPFYLPHSLDHRGRTYATPSFSHQRGDAVKALFEFHEGTPLGADGLDGLKVHIANCGDFEDDVTGKKTSKGSFEERIAWVNRKTDLLLLTADDPERFLLWKKADAPFSFYAAICDFARAIRSGYPYEYVSHIRVDLDGCNSGVQHYSLGLLADEGSLVGLTPGLPADLYSDVAERCLSKAQADSEGFLTNNPDLSPSDVIMNCKGEIKALAEDIKALKAQAKEEGRKLTADELEEIASSSAEVARLKTLRDEAAAAQWVSYGVTRSTVKRPTMTYGYSAEAYGFAEQIVTDLMEPLSDQVALGLLEEHPFGADEGRQAAFYLGRSIYGAVQEALPKVAEGMNWLKAVGTAYGAANIPLQYQMPDGFPVYLAEYKEEETLLFMRELGGVGRVFQPSVKRSTPEINKDKMRSSIAPNCIHSCDAYHLSYTVNMMVDTGFKNIMTIHDSFGVPAAHWRTLKETLVETLIGFRSNWSLFTAIELASVGRPVELPERPARGSLSLCGIARAEYAFS